LGPRGLKKKKQTQGKRRAVQKRGKEKVKKTRGVCGGGKRGRAQRQGLEGTGQAQGGAKDRRTVNNARNEKLGKSEEFRQEFIGKRKKMKRVKKGKKGPERCRKNHSARGNKKEIEQTAKKRYNRRFGLTQGEKGGRKREGGKQGKRPSGVAM